MLSLKLITSLLLITLSSTEIIYQDKSDRRSSLMSQWKVCPIFNGVAGILIADIGSAEPASTDGHDNIIMATKEGAKPTILLSRQHEEPSSVEKSPCWFSLINFLCRFWWNSLPK